jgi:hypothetical protein
VIDRRRLAQREPRSLQPEQLGDLPVTAAIGRQTVRAWVVWEDGVEELSKASQLLGPNVLCGFGLASRVTCMRSGCGPARPREANRLVRSEVSSASHRSDPRHGMGFVVPKPQDRWISGVRENTLMTNQIGLIARHPT